MVSDLTKRERVLFVLNVIFGSLIILGLCAPLAIDAIALATALGTFFDANNCLW